MTKAEYEKLAAFRYELRRFLRFSEQEAKRQGVAGIQYLALLAIEGFPGRDRITIGELAERLHIAAHTAVGLADRLEVAGLARRGSADGDRRQVHLTLTPQGRARLETLAAVHQQELQSSGPALVHELSRLLDAPCLESAL
ncbi:MAG TPA: MarR family transcriptional regulator [Chthoniobacter sp.]|jgi:DNA-binding MarR family transcriptional regulator